MNKEGFDRGLETTGMEGRLMGRKKKDGETGTREVTLREHFLGIFRVF